MPFSDLCQPVMPLTHPLSAASSKMPFRSSCACRMHTMGLGLRVQRRRPGHTLDLLPPLRMPSRSSCTCRTQTTPTNSKCSTSCQPAVLLKMQAAALPGTIARSAARNWSLQDIHFMRSQTPNTEHRATHRSPDATRGLRGQRQTMKHRRTGASFSALWREGLPIISSQVASNRSSATCSDDCQCLLPARTAPDACGHCWQGASRSLPATLHRATMPEMQLRASQQT